MIINGNFNLNYGVSLADPTNFWPGRQGNRIRFIVLHTMQGYQAGSIAWFKTVRPNKESSAHLCVAMNGEVVQTVQDRDTAYHATNLDINLQSIGIETEDFNNPDGVVRTDQFYETLAQVIAWKCREYGIPCNEDYILLHRNVQVTGQKRCPGNLDYKRAIARANEILNGTPAGVGSVGANPTPTYEIVPEAHTLYVVPDQGANVRVSPSTEGANVARKLPKDTRFDVEGYTRGEVVAGNNVWWKLTGELLFISAAVTNYSPTGESEHPNPAPEQKPDLYQIEPLTFKLRSPLPWYNILTGQVVKADPTGATVTVRGKSAIWNGSTYYLTGFSLEQGNYVGCKEEELYLHEEVVATAPVRVPDQEMPVPQPNPVTDTQPIEHVPQEETMPEDPLRSIEELQVENEMLQKERAAMLTKLNDLNARLAAADQDANDQRTRAYQAETKLTNYEAMKNVNERVVEENASLKLQLTDAQKNAYVVAFNGWDLTEVKGGPAGLATRIMLALKALLQRDGVAGFKKGARLYNS